MRSNEYFWIDTTPSCCAPSLRLDDGRHVSLRPRWEQRFTADLSHRLGDVALQNVYLQKYDSAALVLGFRLVRVGGIESDHISEALRILLKCDDVTLLRCIAHRTVWNDAGNFFGEYDDWEYLVHV